MNHDKATPRPCPDCGAPMVSKLLDDDPLVYQCGTLYSAGMCDSRGPRCHRSFREEVDALREEVGRYKAELEILRHDWQVDAMQNVRLKEVCQEIYDALTERNGREVSAHTKYDMACVIPRLRAALAPKELTDERAS